MDTKVGCKKHPYNNPQQGVCSSCLAEKLSNLSTPCNYPSFSNSQAKSTQVGAAYDSFSSSSSGHVSPRADRTRRHARHGSDSTGHVVSASSGLKKSRSMIAYASRKGRDVMVAGGRSGKMMVKKKGGFWAKLIRSTSKRTKDVFTHSRSTTCQQRFDMSHVN